MPDQRVKWPLNSKKWHVFQTSPDDAPTFTHDPTHPWMVVRPVGIAGRPPITARFRTQQDALEWVLRQPEVRRRTAHRRHA